MPPKAAPRIITSQSYSKKPFTKLFLKVIPKNYLQNSSLKLPQNYFPQPRKLISKIIFRNFHPQIPPSKLILKIAPQRSLKIRPRKLLLFKQEIILESCPKLFPKATSQSYSPELLPKATVQNYYPKLLNYCPKLRFGYSIPQNGPPTAILLRKLLPKISTKICS